MATRSAATTITLEMIAEKIAEMLEDSGADAVKVPELASKLDSTPAVIMTVINDYDPDEKVIEGERGELWLVDDSSVPDVSVVETPKPVRKAAKPVKASNGATVTVPVMTMNEDGYARPTGERRELDSALGERVLSEESTNEIRERLTMTDSVQGSWENETPETHFIPFVDGEDVTGHTLLIAPEFIPAPPLGVNPNVWELAFTAQTKPGRTYWYGKAKEQMKSYKAAAESAKVEPVKEVVRITPPIDPETGMPFPF
jgi:hypothetical protein